MEIVMSVAPCAGDDFSCRSVHQTERSQKQIREHTWHPSTDRAARECSSPGNSKSHWSLNWLASHAHMPIWTIQAECKLLERRLEVSSGVPKNVGHPSCWGATACGPGRRPSGGCSSCRGFPLGAGVIEGSAAALSDSAVSFKMAAAGCCAA